MTTIAELRELSDQELVQKVAALRRQLFQMRVQAKLGQLEKGLALRQVRRDIARSLTIERERLRPVEAAPRPAGQRRTAKPAPAGAKA